MPAETVERRSRARRVVPVVACLVVAVAGLIVLTHRSARPARPAAASPTASGAAPSVPAGSAEVFAVHDGGAYGVTADVIYRSPSVQHLVAAKLSATGYPATVEMYQAGVDDDGPSQHPRVAAGEQLFLTAFAIPTCTPDVGLAPVLRLSAESVDGVAVPFDVPVTDWRGVLPATTRVWCARGVMAAMQAGRGTSWCVQSAVLLLRNPAAQGATVTLDGSRYRAKTALVPAGGSAQLRMASRATCGAAKPEPTASVRYDDGTTATVTLPMDGFGG